MKLRWSLATIGATLMMPGGITGVASGQAQTFYGWLSGTGTENGNRSTVSILGFNLSHRPLILALLALALFSSPARALAATENQLLDRGACAALVAGQAADAISSFVSQARGGVETNPVLGKGERPVARIIVAKSAAVAVEAWLMRASARRGYRTFAKVIGYAAGGLGAAYAVKNINALK